MASEATKRHDRVVFLDRDGVINKPPPVGSWVLRWEDFEFADGALAALRRLRERGFVAVVVTNQSCIGRGLVSADEIASINARMTEAVAASGGELAGVYLCPHKTDDGCPCRKPRPGLIDLASRDLGLNPARAFLVGDTRRDIEAGLARACTTILVPGPEDYGTDAPRPHYTAAGLREAAELMIRLVE